MRPGDIVLLHDPQTAGLVEGCAARGARGLALPHRPGHPERPPDQGWGFLRPYLEPADAFIFSRAAYAPAWVAADRLWVIPPSIDPFTAKNQALERAEVAAILPAPGWWPARCTPAPRSPAATAATGRSAGTAACSGGEPSRTRRTRLVLQVSRWDRLKDMTGVLTGFASTADAARRAPAAGRARTSPRSTDDPEGAAVLQECRSLWQELCRRSRSPGAPGLPADGRRGRERRDRQRAAAARDASWCRRAWSRGSG